jgi:hypothetical protein
MLIRHTRTEDEWIVERALDDEKTVLVIRRDSWQTGENEWFVYELRGTSKFEVGMLEKQRVVKTLLNFLLEDRKHEDQKEQKRAARQDINSSTRARAGNESDGDTSPGGEK